MVLNKVLDQHMDFHGTLPLCPAATPFTDSWKRLNMRPRPHHSLHLQILPDHTIPSSHSGTGTDCVLVCNNDKKSDSPQNLLEEAGMQTTTLNFKLLSTLAGG